MYLQALTAGYAVPKGAFNAAVHSVFRVAAYLKLEGDWELLTLTASSSADLPRGIRVGTPEGFTFERLHVGEAATCRDGMLHFGRGSIDLDLRTAGQWDFDLAALNFDASSPRVAASWQLVWRALNERQLASGAEMVGARLLHPRGIQVSETLRRLADGMAHLIAAAAGYDLSVSKAVSSLIGLGQGVTPTGDDLLVGCIAGLWCRIGHDASRKEYVSNLGKALIDLSAGRTTDISRSFLYHAALGHVSSTLAALADAICSGTDSSELLERANGAMSVGHTSGMDAVTGLLLGLAAWDRDALIPFEADSETGRNEG
jgi:hypothetical protein